MGRVGTRVHRQPHSLGLWGGKLQTPLSQVRPEGQIRPSLQDIGQGPTKPTGAEANSEGESAAQNRSTGRTSQPQRPPGSKQFPGLATTQVPRDLQPIARVKPQRLPEGQSESLAQLSPLVEFRAVAEPAEFAGGMVEPHDASSQKAETQTARASVEVCMDGCLIFRPYGTWPQFYLSPSAEALGYPRDAPPGLSAEALPTQEPGSKIWTDVENFPSPQKPGKCGTPGGPPDFRAARAAPFDAFAIRSAGGDHENP